MSAKLSNNNFVGAPGPNHKKTQTTREEGVVPSNLIMTVDFRTIVGGRTTIVFSYFLQFRGNETLKTDYFTYFISHKRLYYACILRKYTKIKCI